MKTTTYLFNDDENIEYDDQLDKAKIGFPVNDAINWSTLPTDFHSNIDDVVNANGYLYFFKKDKYVKFDIIRARVVEGPSPIINAWPGLAGTGFETGVDAATEWPDPDDRSAVRTVLFTRGDECIFYSIDNDSIVKSDIESGLGLQKYPDFSSDIDNILAWKSNYANYAYIFKENSYVRYNLVKKAIDKAPCPISRYWHGVTFTKIQASVSVDDDAMDSCCQCGDVDNGQYSFNISSSENFGLIAYANMDIHYSVFVYVDNQLVDNFSGKGEENTVIGLRTYSSGSGNISVRIEKEGAEPGTLNFCHNRLDSKTRSITISTASGTNSGAPDCMVLINTPLS